MDHEVLIANTLMKIHKNVKSVLAKNSIRYGELRLRSYRLISGDSNTEIIHRESGCSFKLDPQVTYFSTRESSERERICKQIRDKENVLVLFSGVGPFPICIAKHNISTSCYGIELNCRAHLYCVENIKLNKLQNRVTAIQGDVREICPTLNKQFDRVFIGTVLRPHDRIDTQFGEIHFPAQYLLYALMLLRRKPMFGNKFGSNGRILHDYLLQKVEYIGYRHACQSK